ncbi:MAG: CheY-like chemotaxis protein [Planctomycetota bacterium]|jgi:CheY-like chemotaxis protein
MPITTDQPSKTASTVLDSTTTSVALERALHQGLNVPMCALRASMEALSRELPNHREGNVLLRGAIEEVEQIDRKVRDLVEYAVEPTPKLLPGNLNELVETALKGLSQQSRLRVRTSVALPQQKLELDTPFVARALGRVLENALDATPEDVLLVARVQKESTPGEKNNGSTPERIVLVIVNESAHGFDTEWATQAFHSTKPNRLGLGLTLARRDVQLLGGDLHIEALASGAVRVALSLPTRSIPFTTEGDDSKTVVLLEDDPMLCRLLTRSLERRGWNVQRFSRAEDFDLAASNGLEGVLLSDIRLAGSMNGIELIERLRSRGDMRPTLIISGGLNLEQERAAKAAGVLGFLHKPFSLDALGQVVEDLFASHTASPSSATPTL